MALNIEPDVILVDEFSPINRFMILSGSLRLIFDFHNVDQGNIYNFTYYCALIRRRLQTNKIIS